ncbi:MAG: RelA/SpoT family protein [Acidobacteria bacterium]|nr:RelA/SpoT family protein [Acidobacteriota bacterium]
MSTLIPSAAAAEPADIEALASRVERAHSATDAALVRRAYERADASHSGQIRRSGAPYVEHPLAVADILCSWHLDASSIAVGLLHDVLEDTNVSSEELEQEFGEEIVKLVAGVTKIGQIAFNSRLQEQADNFRKLLLAMVDDVRVLLVKLADRLHNMRTLEHLPETKRIRIARETLDIYAPLAHRLGMWRLHTELEDLAFRHLEPDLYVDLTKRVEDRLQQARETTAEKEARIAATMEEHGIPCRVTHRVKGLLSLHRKMQKSQVGLEQIYDVVAYRVITDTVRSCYAALGIIHNRWSPVPGRFKDFVAMPKRNMYQSLHTTLIESGTPFEVQIRTEEMHRVAEEGIAAHWLYKEEAEHSEAETQPLVWLRQLVEQQRDVTDPREFLASLKLNLYPDEVYVFTPKGDVKSMPRGATPLDFAFLIHTEVGFHTTGAKVNGKLVPLRQALRNGDIVEIVTSPDASPSRDWLDLVTTSRARNRIKNWINKQERERSFEVGRRILEKELRKYGLRLRKLLSDGTLAGLGQQFGMPSGEDLVIAVGFGKIEARTIAGRLLPDEELEKRASRKPSRIRTLVDRALGWAAQESISVHGMDGIMVYRARCCGPVPGEPIVGYVTRGKGVAVHAADCGNLSRLLATDERRIDVDWQPPDGAVQPIRLRVEVDDRPGLLAQLTAVISEAGSNIRHIESKMELYRGVVEVVLEVSGADHLRKIINAISTLDGVRAVRRGRTP